MLFSQMIQFLATKLIIWVDIEVEDELGNFELSFDLTFLKHFGNRTC